jgi:hypothetical protein
MHVKLLRWVFSPSPYRNEKEMEEVFHAVDQLETISDEDQKLLRRIRLFKEESTFALQAMPPVMSMMSREVLDRLDGIAKNVLESVAMYLGDRRGNNNYMRKFVKYEDEVRSVISKVMEAPGLVGDEKVVAAGYKAKLDWIFREKPGFAGPFPLMTAWTIEAMNTLYSYSPLAYKEVSDTAQL